MAQYFADYNGKQIEVEEIKIVGQYSQTTEFYLANKQKVTIKIHLPKVLKALTEKYEDGTPVYIIEPQLIIKVVDNENLSEKGEV